MKGKYCFFRNFADYKYKDIKKTNHTMNRKVLLMILDGWGEGRHDYSNAIWTQGTPNIDALRAKYP